MKECGQIYTRKLETSGNVFEGRFAEHPIHSSNITGFMVTEESTDNKAKLHYGSHGLRQDEVSGILAVNISG